MEKRVTLNIAGIKIAIQSFNFKVIDQIANYCQKFVTPEKEEWTLQIEKRKWLPPFSIKAENLRWDIEKFQSLSPKLYVEGDFVNKKISVQPLGSLGWGDILRSTFGVLLVRLGGMLVHGAGIREEGGDAMVFFGPSGRGKTTLSRLAEKSGKKILTDESVAILPQQNIFWAWATPFYGEMGYVSENSGAPLRLAALLEHAKQHQWISLDKKELFKQIMSNLFFFPGNRYSVETLFDNVEKLTTSVDGFRLHFFPDQSVWEFIDDRVRAKTAAQ